MAMFRTIADALTDAGRYLGGFEHDDFVRRLLDLPFARRYEHGGIFIEHFEAPTDFEPYGEPNRNKRNRKWSRS
jgi:hypothetical protein